MPTSKDFHSLSSCTLNDFSLSSIDFNLNFSLYYRIESLDFPENFAHMKSSPTNAASSGLLLTALSSLSFVLQLTHLMLQQHL